MKTLTLNEALAVSDVIVPLDPAHLDTTWRERQKIQYWIRKIYDAEFQLCYEDESLWLQTQDLLDNLSKIT